MTSPVPLMWHLENCTNFDTTAYLEITCEQLSSQQAMLNMWYQAFNWWEGMVLLWSKWQSLFLCPTPSSLPDEFNTFLRPPAISSLSQKLNLIFSLPQWNLHMLFLSLGTPASLWLQGEYTTKSVCVHKTILLSIGCYMMVWSFVHPSPYLHVRHFIIVGLGHTDLSHPVQSLCIKCSISTKSPTQTTPPIQYCVHYHQTPAVMRSQQ